MISVLTPSYNRARELERCFASLTGQTSTDFEWIVVDDGSSDGTEAVVAALGKDAAFPVKYLHKENGGKHTAINYGVPECSNSFVLILDSDDELTPTAIEVLSASAAALPAEAVGIVGNIIDSGTGRIVGRALPLNVEYSTGNELFAFFGTADTLRIYRTDLLAAHPFPVVDGERFMPENVVWDAIDRVGPLRLERGELMRCRYQEDGYSRNILAHRRNSPRGFAMALESSARSTPSTSLAVKRTIAYQVWSANYLGGYGYRSFQRRALFALCLPVSITLRAFRRPSFLFD